MKTATQQPDDGRRHETESTDTVLVVIDDPGDKTRRPRRPNIPYSPPSSPSENSDQPKPE